MVSSLSSLIVQHHLNRFSELDNLIYRINNAKKKDIAQRCSIEGVGLAEQPTLKFFNRQNELVARIPRDRLCASVGYFSVVYFKYILHMPNYFNQSKIMKIMLKVSGSGLHLLKTFII